MKIKTRTVYYCEYCGKHGFQKPAMENHERGCTANINRQCLVCERFGFTHSVPEIIEKLKQSNEKITMDIVRPLVDGCPACMLTVFRAMKDHIDYNINDMWDYQSEHDAFWEKQNSAEQENYPWLY